MKFIFNKLCVSSVGCANLDDLLLKVLITFDHSHTLKIEHIENFHGRLNLKIKNNYMSGNYTLGIKSINK